MNTLSFQQHPITWLKYFLIIAAIVMAANSLKAQNEVCYDRIDNDGDGLVDCLDQDCDTSTTCWDCLSEFYQIHSNSDMVLLDVANNQYTKLEDLSGNFSAINGEAFNPVDGHVYGAGMVNGNHKLVRVNNDGSVTDMNLTLPGSKVFYVGVIDTVGTMYLGAGSTIYSVDLTASNLSVTTTSLANKGIADLAYNKSTGKMYGVKSNSNSLVEFDPQTNSVSTIGLGGAISLESGAFGAAWSSNDGSMFFANNKSGNVFNISLSNSYGSLVLKANGNLSTNDGFNCINALPPMESFCNNGIDDDGDGDIDCDDSDCYANFACVTEQCYNGIDDDGDGLVDCDDNDCSTDTTCTGSVGSGGNGGLESNDRLAMKIARRNYNRMDVDVNTAFPKEDARIYAATKRSGNRMFKSSTSIQDFIPVDAIANTRSYVSSPTDLLSITNAEEVFSIDVYRENHRMASVLAIETSETVYEHSKYICDRVHGGTIKRIFNQKAGDYSLLFAHINEPGGVDEYASSFALHLDDAGKVHLESHWSLNDFPTSKQYFNFQVWGNSIQTVVKLAEDIIEKFKKTYGPLQFHQGEIPQAYVQSGRYDNGKLYLQIKNLSENETILLSGAYKSTESAPSQKFEKGIALAPLEVSNVEVNIGPIFEIGFELIAGEADNRDLIYLADGTWAYDFADQTAEVYEFEVSPETRQASEDYFVERNVSILGIVEADVALFRAFNPSYKPVDLTDYNTLQMKMEGEGRVRITLIKSSVSDISQQPYVDVSLTNESSSYTFNQGDFNKETGDAAWDDVKMIVFSIQSNSNNSTSFELKVNDVAFTRSFSSDRNAIETAFAPSFEPNPVQSLATMNLSSLSATDFHLTVTDINGQTVYEKNDNTSTFSKVSINLSDLPSGVYMYELFLQEQGELYTGKLLKI